jgi:hypothetical protein
LDPGLTSAEHLLAEEEPRLLSVVHALPDESAAALRLNETLASAGTTPQLDRTDSGWRIFYVALPADIKADGLASAAAGLAEVVSVAGWKRIKKCLVCQRFFCDRTSGNICLRCPTHRRRS